MSHTGACLKQGFVQTMRLSSGTAWLGSSCEEIYFPLENIFKEIIFNSSTFT